MQGVEQGGAVGKPHLCRPALGSPTASRASPGAPHRPAPSGSLRPAAAGRLDAGEEQASASDEDTAWFLAALLASQGPRH